MTETDASSEATSNSSSGILKKGAVALAGLFLVLQIIPNPAGVEPNPEQRSSLESEPPEVVEVLKRACYDCHSNETNWPLYSRIAPSSWLVHHDVGEGRDFLNFSNWDEMDDDDKYYARETAAELVNEGEMPPQIYIVPFHAEAKLSDADKALLTKWAEDQE